MDPKQTNSDFRSLWRLDAGLLAASDNTLRMMQAGIQDPRSWRQTCHTDCCKKLRPLFSQDPQLNDTLVPMFSQPQPTHMQIPGSSKHLKSTVGSAAFCDLYKSAVSGFSRQALAHVISLRQVSGSALSVRTAVGSLDFCSIKMKGSEQVLRQLQGQGRLDYITRRGADKGLACPPPLPPRPPAQVSILQNSAGVPCNLGFLVSSVHSM